MNYKKYSKKLQNVYSIYALYISKKKFFIFKDLYNKKIIYMQKIYLINNKKIIIN